MNFMYALLASVVISVVSLVGIITLLFNDRILKKTLLLLIGLSAGGLIGGAFLHILPEAVEHSQNYLGVFLYVIAGFVFFFVLEHALHWRHCHNDICEVHAFAYMNLVGDAAHNFVDGIIIGTSFVVSVPFGVATAVAILLHEIPQEIGDFGVLVYGGFSRAKALFMNFCIASICILGTVLGYFFSNRVAGLPDIILPVAAGGFIYIASCDLIPEIHREPNMKKALLSMAAFMVGLVLMYVLKMSGAH